MLNFIVHLVPQKHFELEESFKSLAVEDKWTLRGGKIVEDSMYEFSKNCVADHPACSMIIYTEDDTYLKNDIFTKEELQKIAEKDPIGFTTPIPKPLADYMNKPNKNNIAELRAIMSRDHDFDCVKLIVFLYVRLYESGELNSKQLETWYDRKVRSSIDNAFDDVPSL